MLIKDRLRVFFTFRLSTNLDEAFFTFHLTKNCTIECKRASERPSISIGELIHMINVMACAVNWMCSSKNKLM
jgi:hypothetical protein